MVPVTVIKAGPCVVVQRKTSENDGYDAVQLGLVDRSTTRGRRGRTAPVNQPVKGTSRRPASRRRGAWSGVRRRGRRRRAQGGRLEIDVDRSSRKTTTSTSSASGQGQGLPGRHQAPRLRRWSRDPRLDVPPRARARSGSRRTPSKCAFQGIACRVRWAPSGTTAQEPQDRQGRRGGEPVLRARLGSGSPQRLPVEIRTIEDARRPSRTSESETVMKIDSQEPGRTRHGAASLESARRGVRLPATRSTLVHEAVVAIRRGTAARDAQTKNPRTRCRGGGRKPWRQKGTGRARSRQTTARRCGASRRNRARSAAAESYACNSCPREMRNALKFGALSQQALATAARVIEAFDSSTLTRTKAPAERRRDRAVWASSGKALVVDEWENATWRWRRATTRASRSVDVHSACNVYDVVDREHVVFSRGRRSRT